MHKGVHHVVVRRVRKGAHFSQEIAEPFRSFRQRNVAVFK